MFICGNGLSDFAKKFDKANATNLSICDIEIIAMTVIDHHCRNLTFGISHPNGSIDLSNINTANRVALTNSIVVIK